MNKTAKRFLIGFTILFILFLATIIYLANNSLATSFFLLIHRLPLGDKLGHLLLMGMLSFLVNLILGARQTEMLGLRLPAGSLLVAIVVTLEECSQIFLPSRSFSIGDLLFDYAGIIVGGRMAVVLLMGW